MGEAGGIFGDRLVTGRGGMYATLIPEHARENTGAGFVCVGD